MPISLEVVQNLAPDQASLNAAKKLLSPAKWPMREQSSSIDMIWGQCKGSGSNPYFTMANSADHGYKCTCPSRKFPCKHVLALMWMYNDDADAFRPADQPPQWVSDWMSRRRGSKPTGKDSGTKGTEPTAKKNIHATRTQEQTASPEELAKKAAAQAKRAQQNRDKTIASVTAGLQELQLWIEDQLRTGIVTFLQEVTDRCRQIAARLVDAKAAALASRLDELPARILEIRLEQQPGFVFNELGQIVLLCEAWLTNHDAADVWRNVVSAEKREDLLARSDVLRHTSLWECVGEQVYTRRDGLVTQATWLLDIAQATPQFALLLDHFPAQLGKRQSLFTPGQQLAGEMVYYPSHKPLRAFFNTYEVVNSAEHKDWLVNGISVWDHYSDWLQHIPWVEQVPSLLTQGKLYQREPQEYWWVDADKQTFIPLTNHTLPALHLGSALKSAVILWNGKKGTLLSVQSQRWGSLSC